MAQPQSPTAQEEAFNLDPISDVSSFFENIYEMVTSNFSTASLVYQALLAVTCLLISSWLALRIRSAITEYNKTHGQSRSLAESAARWLMRRFGSLFFSLCAASMMALSSWALREVGFFAHSERFLLISFLYTILYAWAILLALLDLGAEMISSTFLGPKVRRTICIIFWTLTALHIFGILPRIIAVMKAAKLPFGSDNVTVWSALVCTITILISLGIANWLSNIAQKVIMRTETLEPNLKVMFSRLSTIVLTIFALWIGFSGAGIDLTVLSVFGGAMGVGLGFGMQKIAANYISGIIILLDRSVKLGDLIEVAGFSGKITQINTRYSVIKNLADEELIVPNESFVTSIVKNYTYSNTTCVVTVTCSVAYEADFERALEIMKEVAKRQPRVLKDHEPWAVISDLGDSGINLKVGFWVHDPVSGFGGLKSAIFKDILKAYQAEGIEIPYNKLEINVTHPVRIGSQNSPD